MRVLATLCVLVAGVAVATADTKALQTAKRTQDNEPDWDRFQEVCEWLSDGGVSFATVSNIPSYCHIDCEYKDLLEDSANYDIAHGYLSIESAKAFLSIIHSFVPTVQAYTGPFNVSRTYKCETETVRDLIARVKTAVHHAHLAKTNTAGSCNGTFASAAEGTLTGDFLLYAEGSESPYIYTPPTLPNIWTTSSNWVEFCFVVGTGGFYRIKGVTGAYGAGDNSFFVSVDGGSAYLWDLPWQTWADTYVSDRNGQQPVSVYMAAGHHTVSVFMRESGARLQSLELELIPTAGSVSTTATCGGLVQEAESGVLHGEFAIMSDSSASGTQFVAVPYVEGDWNYAGKEGETSYVEMCFDVPTSGIYSLEAWAKSTSLVDNSFWVTIDDAPSDRGNLWDIPITHQFGKFPIRNRSKSTAMLTYLDAGNHVVKFYKRESGSRLDKVELVLTQFTPYVNETAHTDP